MQNNYLEIIIFGVAFFLLVVWVLVLHFSFFGLRKRQKIMFSGKSGKDLEKIIIDSKKKIELLDGDVKDLYDITAKVHKLSLKSIHKASVVRFNPFRDLGGDQSFSVAFLDADNDGVVISSLYSRDGVRVYAKAIKGGESIKYPLAEEEKEAIKRANIKKESLAERKKL